MRLNGKVAVVTGAGGGFGAGIAERFAAEGARVALVGVEDLIVVASGKDILILPRGRSQEVKALIEAMKR